MTPLFPAQRAAEEFDQALAGTADSAVQARYADLLEAVATLRDLPEVSPRAEFVGDLRSRLMTAAETELVSSPRAARSVAPVTQLAEVRTRQRNRRLGTVAAALVIVGGSAGMAAAASGALPGQNLYPVKRGIENAETAARFDAAGQGKSLLGQAETRLDEVKALQAEGSTDPDLMTQTVDAFQSAAGQGSAKLFSAYRSSGDASDISAVREFTSSQMAEIATMSLGSDTATNDLLRNAADTLAEIDQQAVGMCASCGSRTALQPPAELAAGAAAVTMATMIARPVTQADADIAHAAALRQKQLDALRNQAKSAEKQADAMSTATDGTTTPNLLDPTSNGGSSSPLTSVVTPDGSLVPSVTTGAAVSGLVSSVTAPLDKATGGATSSLGKTLGDTTSKVTGKVDSTVNGLLP